MAQGQDFLHHCRVVKLGSIAFGLVGGAGDVGVIDLLAQCAALGKLHHGQIAGHFQRELVALFAIGFGSRLGGGNHVGRDTFELFCAGVVGKGIGCVQSVFAELLRQFGRARLNLRKTLLGRTLQLGTRKHKAAHDVVPGGALLLVQTGGVNGLVLGVQTLVGAQVGPELGDLGQGFVVGGA